MNKLSSLKARAVISLLSLCSSLIFSTNAQAQSSISPPNGTHSQQVVDLVVQSSLGAVEWKRVFNGSGWRFNRHWDGINASFKPVTVQNTGGGAPGQSSAGGGAVCWIWVDEDWQPGSDASPLQPSTTPQPRFISPNEYIPPNNAYNQTSAPLDTSLNSFFSACASSGGNITGGNGSDIVEVFEGFRRQSQLYVGSGGTYIFKSRNVLKKQAIQRLPNSTGEPDATPANFTNLVSSASGWRWSDRGGDWAEYDDTGRITRYGDRNNNIIWIQRNASGQISRIIDAGQTGNNNPASSAAAGRVLITLHYNAAGYLVQAKDHPFSDLAGDNLQRTVGYQYDSLGRMTAITDVRGKTHQHGYDFKARLTSSTDPLGRITRMTYEDENNSVKQMTTADGAVSDFVFSYDDTKKIFYSKMQGPVNDVSGTPLRRTEEYTHDRAGDLIRYEVNGRAELATTRDPVARTESRTNARGFTTILTKNEFEQVVQVQHPDGARQSTQFEARWLNPIEMTDELGFKTIYSYDNNGNLIKKTEAQGTPDERVTEYELSSAGWPTKFTRKGKTEANGAITPDAVWLVEYDSAGQIKKTTDPEGHVRQYQFNRFGQLLKYTDPRGKSSSYVVDTEGRLTSHTDPVGRTRLYTYDNNGNLSSLTDARGKTAAAAYDVMNRRSQITNPVGGIAKAQFNPDGLPISETDEDNRVQRFEYDNFLRLTKLSDALSNVTQHGYAIADGTNAGTLGSLTEPSEIKYPTFTQRQRFDARERQTSVTLLNPNSLGTEGLVSSTEYDARGQVKSETDANGKTRYYKFDAIGQLIEQTDSLGHKTTLTYDVRGNLTRITNAKGNAHRMEFDRNNRVTKEIQPLGQAISYSYDPAGNVSEQTNALGNKSTYAYDDANRLIEIKQYRGSSALERTTALTWDAEDNLTAWAETDATRPAGQQNTSGTATYDDASRKKTESVTYPTGYSLNYAYAYSPAGRLTQLTWPDGTAIDYSYSAHGELETVAIPGEGSISVSQFKWIAPSRITLPGGIIQERTLDGLLYPESIKVKTPGQQTILSLANTFGKVQELKSQARSDLAGTSGSNASSSRNSTFQYDSETRLTQASVSTGNALGNDVESFTLDALGNRIASSKVSGAWSYDANNRLLKKGSGACGSAGSVCYDWDEAGNIVQTTEGPRITQYKYDTQQRLTEVTQNNPAIAGQFNPIARYGYDPLDRRLWKEQYRGIAGQLLAQPLRTYFLYAEEGLIAEATQPITLAADGTVSPAAGSPAPQITTQYGPHPERDFTTGVLFLKTQNTNNNTNASNSANNQPVFAYLHHDHLQTPVQATDKAGNLLWAAHHNAFGRASIVTPAPTANAPTINLALRLPGQYEDPETGLHYNYRRYYDPETGRYLTQDPIGLEGGINVFSYAQADPVNLTDPTGEIVPVVVAGAVCMASCMAATAAEDLITGECTTVGTSAKNCAIGCAMGGVGALAMKVGKWGKRAYDNLPCAINSFPADTLVHIQPADLASEDSNPDQSAAQGKSQLIPISRLQPGDKVLALSEWKDAGNQAGQDQRLTYEKVTDVFTSLREQTHIYLTLDNGQTIQATEGHPFLTSEGWRDAVLLKRGGKLLIKGEADAADAADRQTTQEALNKAIYKPNQPVAGINTAQSAIESIIKASQSNDANQAAGSYRTILDIRTERQTVQVFNIEVANAHTFFVGDEGVLVHNAIPGGCKKMPGVYRFFDRLGDEYIGKAKDLYKRLRQHEASGKLPKGNTPDVIKMPGSSDLDRSIVEQAGINFGGRAKSDGGTMANAINSMSPARQQTHGVPRR